MKIKLGTGAGGDAMLDLEVMMRTNLLLQAASGGGKSRSIRRLAEQCCEHVPVGIIDVDGEFASLREKFPFVLIGPGGETPADPRSAALVARKMLELGTSFVADIYELPVAARKEWVRNFLTALIDAPKSLWRQFIFVIDEAHLFAPEQGHGRDGSVALSPIVDIGSRGRKRGFCLVAATQRIGKLSKDVVAELKNVFIGLATLDVDRERAAEALGKTRDRKSRNDFYDSVKFLKPGEFYGLGQAFANTPTLFRFGDVQTTHPEPGKQTKATPPPPLSKIKGLLPQLKDLPKEAEEEARTVAQMRAKIADLEEQIANGLAPVEIYSGSPVDFDAPEFISMVEALDQKISAFIASAECAGEDVQAAAEALRTRAVSFRDGTIQDGNPPRNFSQMVARNTHVATLPQQPTRTPKAGGADPQPSLGAGERRIMIAVAQSREASPEQISVLTGFKRSTRDAYLQRLRAAGYVMKLNGGSHAPTEDGINWLGNDYRPLPTGRALIDHWLSELPGGEAAVLRAVLGTRNITRDAISEATGFKRSTRDAYIQRLSTRKLVESSNGCIVPSRSLRT